MLSRARQTSPVFASLVALAGCVAEPSPDAAPHTSVAEGASEAGEAGEDAALDLAGGPAGAGCTKVDLLFVIDDSHSMGSKQGALVESFPGFVDQIRSRLGAGGSDRYHVGVITTDAYAFNAEACRELGALVTRTGGTSSSDATCGPFASGPFLSEGDDLDAGFACAARVGVEGSNDERPIEALLDALGPELAGGCNLGFRRDDALLVVVIITDEEDDREELLGEQHGSPGDPDQWFAAVEHEVGVETNVAVLTICGGHPDDACGQPEGIGAEDAPRLREFTGMFTHGFTGDVCAGDYEPFFDEAIAVVEDACETFVP